MTELYPMRFQPVFRQYIWGGRRLKTVLNKPIDEGENYAESWEIVDHGQDQSVVAHGPLAGKTLREVVARHHLELFGRHSIAVTNMRSGEDYFEPRRFPLLFKLLDCNRNLSVQVHPSDEQAARLDPPDLGKTEAWVILAAEPGSRIYAGLRPGVDQNALAAAIENGDTEACLHKVEPRPGDCVFIPAGTVHALGAGLLVAEIQQASDTTFRLFDWNRVGADGQPRELHVTQSLEVIDYTRGPVELQTPQPVGPETERLVECDKFVLDRRKLTGEATVGGDDRFHILYVLNGEIRIDKNSSGRPLAPGQTMLLPAYAGPVNLSPSAPTILLDMYLP